MKNIKITIQYDGSRYNGWQKQGNTDNTIQGKLENVLSKYFNQEIEVHGSGRTDAGVHAAGQVANFKFDEKLCDEKLWSEYENVKGDLNTGLKQKSDMKSDTEKIMYDLNYYLPEDIKIISLEEVDLRFHARLNAKKKHYRYYVSLSDKRDVFQRKYIAAYNSGKELNVEKMKSAAKLFIGVHDFAGFSDNKSKKKSTVREVESIEFTMIPEDDVLIVDFVGNGFLYHMVRLMMGTLLDIGYGNSKESLIAEILTYKDRKKVPFMAAAEGFFLQEVGY